MRLRASGSVAASVPTVVPAGWFSATAAGDSVMSVGARFSETSVTVIANAFWNTAPRSSRTRTRTE